VGDVCNLRGRANHFLEEMTSLGQSLCGLCTSCLMRFQGRGLSDYIPAERISHSKMRELQRKSFPMLREVRPGGRFFSSACAACRGAACFSSSSSASYGWKGR
jgi:hypothetical protein